MFEFCLPICSRKCFAQLKTLADLRAGSLPPKPDETDDEKRRKRDDGDKGGAKTEPESATEVRIAL